jgi:outer membrane biosynthesis protein TonB
MRGFGSILAFGLLALTFLTPADWAAAEPSEEQVAAIKANCRSDFMSKCWGVPRGGAEAMQCLKKNMASVSAPCQQALKAVTAAAPAEAPSAPATAAKQESAPATPAQPSPAAAPPTPSSETPAQGTEAKAAAPAEPAKPKAAVASPHPAAAQQEPKVAAPPAASTAATGVSAKATTGAETLTEQPSVKKPGDAPATALASPEATPIIGFIPPRKKLMILKNCRQDLDTYCSGVSYGEGRQLSCLVSNRAALSPDCQGALAKLAR